MSVIFIQTGYWILDNFFHDSTIFVLFIQLIKHKIESIFLTFHNFFLIIQ